MVVNLKELNTEEPKKVRTFWERTQDALRGLIPQSRQASLYRSVNLLVLRTVAGIQVLRSFSWFLSTTAVVVFLPLSRAFEMEAAIAAQQMGQFDLSVSDGGADDADGGSDGVSLEAANDD